MCMWLADLGLISSIRCVPLHHNQYWSLSTEPVLSPDYCWVRPKNQKKVFTQRIIVVHTIMLMLEIVLPKEFFSQLKSKWFHSLQIITALQDRKKCANYWKSKCMKSNITNEIMTKMANCSSEKKTLKRKTYVSFIQRNNLLF